MQLEQEEECGLTGEEGISIPLSFNNYLLNTFYVSDIVLRPGDKGNKCGTTLTWSVLT